MRIICIFISFNLFFSYTYTQNAGKIVPVKEKPESGITNAYLYKPPKHLAIPDKLYASIVYVFNQQYCFKRIPVIYINGMYKFSFKAPSSTEVLIISVNDDKSNPIDNNNELGFISYFYNKKGNISASAIITATYLLSYDAIRPLRLNYEKLKPVMIKLFEEAYKMSPDLKNDKSYTYYLTILYQERKDAVKPELLVYAGEMASSKQDEPKWIKAIKIYQLLEMNNEKQIIEKRAVKTYPNGEVAKRLFLNNFYIKDTTELSILKAIEEYISRFKDTSSQMKYTFYGNMIEVLLRKKEWDKAHHYALLMSDKINSSSIYNNYARELCGGSQLDYKGSDIKIAKMLSKKSLDYVGELIKDPAIDSNNNDGSLERLYNKCADTYAIILYKLEDFDSAFYYQDLVYQNGENTDAAIIERYAFYAEKVKGPAFAYQVIADQILKGISSSAMLEQLSTFAQKSGIPDSTYNSLITKSVRFASKNSSEKIKGMFGTVRSKNFVLKDLKGRVVSLSSLKNKVVVLIFWATWCVPCLNSFPSMNKIVNLYKTDNDIVFLFIDTWEKGGKEKMVEAAIKLIKGKNYDFEVLLDEKNRVADDYKVDLIPSHFIINKKGNIVFMGESSNLVLDIENARH